ncbi:MAG TPA: heme-binding protein [Syntrophales bacterium]|nr:heme-binding protein [Syntrophales bacterium]
MRIVKVITVISVVLFVISGVALAQQMPNPYGPNISLATAKKVAAAAAAEAMKIKINVVITVVDTGGNLIYLERFDVVQYGSIDAALHKAKCSVAYKRPTKAFEDTIGSGKTAYLTLDGISAIEGGVPIIQDGKIIGAIGVSGGSAAQDGQVATAGAKVIK